ncbi:chitotriosidase-1 [Nannizzia gypsea CBS 118893]|uniref:chitinase n=1 Tax=Arthroderma gypseum (strain ATCC MYA-4604 / CBS 118893) TaxID=535722 RepID=E5R1R5_ARTGP|nr:chitotriosidase-1 [Nannizzia gypsea CBS 118893]EFQ98549.1 chitotriosidase-1 [Nannizzia gypsea CBS 118893]
MALTAKANRNLRPLSLFFLATALFFLCKLSEAAIHGEAAVPGSNVPGANFTEIDIYQSSSFVQFAKKGTDYSCRKGVPCKNNACCGSFMGTNTGICGFGDAFCGGDCDSKCDAKAECGKYADPPGKECPLKVCCSKYGFCGSSAEFCGTGCQSNCIEKPPLPPGGSAMSVLGNKIIGYYEAWADRRTCREFPPSSIPVQGLTHVNFAFAYVDPDSLTITAMDSSTPASLFSQVTDIKNMKSRSSTLEVYISLGGWTFSDNGTSTQSVFPSIAADPEKRQKFADNLVTFMRHYGFDGVDLDWEYPGAPDRGGNGKEDIPNYVALLKTLRQTFKASARGNYGLSFTIPTSYWYLKWFDVPGLLQYADWVNLMTYDLHGVWDQHNPIGNIVQGHTNLTEIQAAFDLLWRNNVPPGKVVMGVGFYGRSFQLKDRTCAHPGCEFSGPANAGSCTKSAGTLAYFEIMDIIKNEKPEVVHDAEAAVNYFAYGDQKDQWISYDDSKTLQQKVKWADSKGLGGVLVWSVDQDDNSFSALEGLIGEPLPAFSEKLKRHTIDDAGHWSSTNGQACRVSECVKVDTDPPSGYTVAPNGKFPDTCSGGEYKYVWCPTHSMPDSCEWRGSGSCHGQCHPGEVTLAHSPHGSLSCLRPGQQAFCCVSSTWAKHVEKCRWGEPHKDCPSDVPYALSTKNSFPKYTQEHFCCPFKFENCHWVGKGTCDDNECSSTDVQVALDPVGDGSAECFSSDRRKPLCCNPPANVNPFLPVPLEDLFPTLPPLTNIPAFDLQPISYVSSLATDKNDPSTFFLVVIDGPPGTVSNANKRDGSDLEFVSGAVHHGQSPQTAHFVCMNNSSKSNCNDMHSDGLEGTILRMPDGMGFAKYAVAHSVKESNFSVPRYLAKRAPIDAKVFELEYSYNFSKAKRGDEPIYFRVDYSDTDNYYTEVVKGHHQKRNLGRRFWSSSKSVWKNLFKRLRGQVYNALTQPSLSYENFNTLIYGNDGKKKGCKGADGFLKLNLSGSMRNVMQFGFTIIGTMHPFAIDEAYGFYDSSLHMSGKLEFDGKGELSINEGVGVSRKLLRSSITKYEASHPGLVSFSPSMNADISLVGSGYMDGRFTANFEVDWGLGTHAPPDMGKFYGYSISPKPSNPSGYISVKEATYNDLFSMNINLETTMELNLFDYKTSEQNAKALFTARVPHAIRVVGNVGSGNPAVINSPQQATSEVIQTGIQSGWDDGTTHLLGHRYDSYVLFSGGEAPVGARETPEINGYALFGDKDFMSCSEPADNLTCTFSLAENDPSYSQPSLENQLEFELKQSFLESLSDKERALYNDTLSKRAGPSSGHANTYAIYDWPDTGNNYAFNFETPTYPNGGNGAALDAETGRNERYSLANPTDCVDTSITANGVLGTNYMTVETEHPFDRTIFPTHFANFIQRGVLDLDDRFGTRAFTTNLPTWEWEQLYDTFAHDYRIWVPRGRGINIPPGTPSADVANALGSTSNPGVLSNLERDLNASCPPLLLSVQRANVLVWKLQNLKGRVYTTSGDPTSDDVWDGWMTATATNANIALSSLRAIFAVFNYMNAISSDRAAVLEDITATLEQFDEIYGQVYPTRPERLAPLWAEFQTQWNIRVVYHATSYLTRRLDSLYNLWNPLTMTVNPLRTAAVLIVTKIRTLRAKIPTEIRL